MRPLYESVKEEKSEADKMFEELGYIEHFNTKYAECYRKDSSRSLGRQIAFNNLNKNIMLENYMTQDELKAINLKCKELKWI